MFIACVLNGWYAMHVSPATQPLVGEHFSCAATVPTAGAASIVAGRGGGGSDVEPDFLHAVAATTARMITTTRWLMPRLYPMSAFATLAPAHGLLAPGPECVR